MARGQQRQGNAHHDDARERTARWGMSQEDAAISSRAFVVLGIFVLIALLFCVRLFYLQVIKAEEYSALAENERTADIEISPRRGTIYDRNGNVLAISVDATTVYANPSEVTLVEYTAYEIAQVLGGDVQDYIDAINNSESKTFVYIKQKADVDKAEQLKELGLDGIYFIDDTRREYPYGQTGGQVIGFCNADGEGVSGLEAYYDEVLRGEAGRLVVERAVDGTTIPGGVHEDTPSVDGQDIMVSLDIELQAYVEERLLQDEEGLTASGGTSIVMDAGTGEIYAAASLPLFNPSDPSESEVGSDQLVCITQALEPGSNFKTVTALAALETGTMKTEDELDCPAVIEADGYQISDAEDRADTTYTLREIIQYSSNVGISLTAEKLGFDKLYDYILKYRLHELTGVDYPGESEGYLLDFGSWSRVQGYNTSFGQGISVTPLQMTCFYGSLLNDGVSCTPHFLMTKLSENETVKWQTHDIIENKDAIPDMVSMLESVVSDGTAMYAQIDGYDVAGKTSTAEIASESGGYETDVYNVAFVGFIANSNSKLVCYTGAYRTPWESVTTLIFRDIMTFAIDRYRITPEE